MFDPTKLDSITSIEDKDLVLLPSSEDDRHEYKSSSGKDAELADKIARAASGFWNSGGGLFVAGVNGRGQPDGGLPAHVGRQTRRDWVDQAIARVYPPGRYVVRCVQDSGAGLNISAGNHVVLIGFGESEIGPHMAPDHRYYIRAGAHTVPAPHFIVEAIHARRGRRIPLLRPIVRRRPDNGSILQLGIVALTDIPALDVEINLAHIPHSIQNMQHHFPLRIAVVSHQFPFFFDFKFLTTSDSFQPTFNVFLRYFDLSGKEYRDSFPIDVYQQTGPDLGTIGTGHDDSDVARLG
jgi:hypothetical protein